MEKKCTLVKDWLEKPVYLVGGFHHVEKGYMVEILGGKSRQSVSFSVLKFNTEDRAARAFLEMYSITPAEAKKMGHRKGVPRTRCPFK